MTREIHDVDELQTWWRTPTVDRWVRWVIVCAAGVTLAIAAIGPRLLWTMNWAPADRAAHQGIDPITFKNALAIFAGCWLAACALPDYRVSRLIRIAVLLPIAHLVLIAAAWVGWVVLAPRMPEIVSWTAMVRMLPLSVVAAAIAGATAGLAWLVARRHRREWPRSFAMLALVELLLLGLWLPIAAWMCCRDLPTTWWSDEVAGLALHDPLTTAAIVIVPPLLAATAYTAFALRRPAAVPRRFALACLGGLLFVALLARYYTSPLAAILYANFTHVLLATATVAIAAIGTLGATVWTSARAARRRLATQPVIYGVVADDDPGQPIVGCIEITSWLHGPRHVLRSFVATTASGTVPLHNARLVAPIATATTQLAVGHAVAVLRAGDAIAITGLDRTESGDPFRTSAVPFANADVIVTPREPGRYDLVDVALVMWRPAIAYLLILVAIAGPALAAIVRN